MTAATFILFPDGREAEAVVVEVNKILRDRNVGATEYHAPFRPSSHITPIPAWTSHGNRLEPEEMLSILRARDWVWPALVVYRTSEDNRWNFVTLGLNTPEGLGEDE